MLLLFMNLLTGNYRFMKWKSLVSMETQLCHMMFSWKLSGERVCDVLLEWTLERAHYVCKGYKYNPTEGKRMILHWFTLQCFAGLH